MTELHRVEIDTNGMVTKLSIGGHNIASIATSATLSLRSGELPTLTVKLSPREALARLTEAVSGVDEESHAALVALGWTPPQEEP